MHARVTTAKVQPGKVDEFVGVFREQVLPNLKQDKGFKNVSLFTNRQANSVVAVAVYETEENIRGAEPAFRERVAMVAGVLAETPATEIYELSVQG
jgi:quinol monooxygenase YgiN